MIDKAKLQIEVLKDMLSNSPSMRMIEISEQEIGITNGFYVVILPKSELKIKYELLPKFEYTVKEMEYGTPLLHDSKVRKLDGGKTLVKLVSNDKTAVSIANGKYLSVFSGYDFYSRGGNNEIYVYDGIGNLVGLILPIRCKDF